MRSPQPQHFTAHFAERVGFEGGGLRGYFAYRDLGLRAGTHGLVQAHVLRAVQPCPPGGTGWHSHRVEFQMIYVLAGTIATELEGQGRLTFRAGDSWLQPPDIRHCVMDYSQDLELLEMISPADFETVESIAPPRPPNPNEEQRAMKSQHSQRFTAHFAERVPYQRGLREYMEYRDLGMRDGTNGLVQAHVLRAAQPCPPGGTGWHCHDVEFQMIYVLKGSITSEFEGQGELTFNAGDSWLQPPGIVHQVTAYTDDLEVLEVISPADFATRDAALE